MLFVSLFLLRFAYYLPLQVITCKVLYNLKEKLSFNMIHRKKCVSVMVSYQLLFVNSNK